jgi:signal transduction histidine kinase/DNA-binding response OmpR family regulator
MSGKRLSKRLENIFADVVKEGVSPEPGPRPAADAAPATTPAPVSLPRDDQGVVAKSLVPERRTVPPVDLKAGEEAGVISTAFRQDEKTWATLRLIDESDSHTWTDQEQMLVKQVADQLSLALENARLYQETKRTEEALERQNERLSAAAEIGRLVTSTLDLDTILSRTVQLVSERFGFYHAAIFIAEGVSGNAVLLEATGAAGAQMKASGYSLPVDTKSAVGRATLTGESAVVNDTSLARRYMVNPLLPDTRAECAIPLHVGDRIIGALDIQATSANAFQPDDLSVLQILADQVAIAIENARSYELAQQAVKDMRELDRVKTQFLANMSHELRTPLNSIIGFSRVILKGIDGPISELQQQDLGAIYSAGQHLLGLINDVLDLAKIEAGKMDMSLEETNVAEIISSMMSTASGLVKDKPIRLTQKVPDDLPTVRADAIRVRQILLNLLSNAAKFTEQGDVVVEAATESSADGTQQVRISVTDTGTGISEADQKKLFQAFSQVDDSPTRKTGGSGLGLSISQQLVQLQGGRIGLKSTPGQGSTFFFTLPVYESAPEAKTGATPRLVLAVDDDPQVIRLYERYLQPQGYQVVGLTDPTKAKETAAKLQPFAITLDIMMPGYDGWQVLTDLKRDGATKSIPVVVCSILEQKERGFSLGAADYVLKPILGDGLLNALDRLGRAQAARQVLLLDDDPDALHRIRGLLENQPGYQVATARAGSEVWKAISANPPDAILLALPAPNMDGFSVLEKLRGEPASRRIPVVALGSGSLTEDQQRKLTDYGVPLMGKDSLTQGDLLDTLRRTLEHSHS